MTLDQYIDELKDAVGREQPFLDIWGRFTSLQMRSDFMGFSLHRRNRAVEQAIAAACQGLSDTPEVPANRFLTLRYAHGDFFHGGFRMGEGIGAFIYFKSIDQGVFVFYTMPMIDRTVHEFVRFSVAHAVVSP